MRTTLELERYGLEWEIEFEHSYQKEVNGGLPENSYPEYFDWEILDVNINGQDVNELFELLEMDEFLDVFDLKTLLGH